VIGAAELIEWFQLDHVMFLLRNSIASASRSRDV